MTLRCIRNDVRLLLLKNVICGDREQIPLLMIERKFFERCKSGEKDVELKNMFEARRTVRGIYPEDEEFMAFELV